MIITRSVLRSILMSVFCLMQAGQLDAFGEPGKPSSSLEPKFIPLEEGQGSYTVKVYDDKNVIVVKDTSFSGRASVGGIRSEKDDSTMQLKLSKIKEIKIVKPAYQSNRFRDQEFTLASIIANNGKVVDGVLIPKNLVLCGIEDGTQIERAWVISRIDKLVIESGTKPEKKPKVKKESQQEINQKAVEQQVELAKKSKQKSVHRGILDAVEGIFGAIYDLIIAVFQSVVRLIA